MRRDTEKAGREAGNQAESRMVHIERRELLKLLGVAAGAASIGGCDRRWAMPERLVELALRGPGLETESMTICGLCESGCGLAVRLVDGLPVGIKGNTEHPLNRGGVCPVGLAALEILYSPDRVQGPVRRSKDGVVSEVSWDSASEEIVGVLKDLQQTGRGDKVALLSGHADLLFNDLARQFVEAVGSKSMARLDSESTVPYRLTQGLDEIPGFDLGRADFVLSFGLEIYEDGSTPLHAIQSTIGSRAAGERATLVYVGSHMSPSAAKADLRVSVHPGTLGAFALGVAHVIVREGRYDQRFVSDHTFGFEDWVDADGEPRLGFRRLLLEQYYPDKASQLCGCEPDQVIRVARRFASAAAPVALSGGVANRGPNETFTVAAIHALNALMGNFDKPGGVALPPAVPYTPMPDLGGGAGESTRSLFAPASGASGLGVDPVEALVESVARGEGPEILFIVDSDPVHASPVGRDLREAMAAIPTVVVLTSFMDHTALVGDYVLPTPTFLESWHSATTPTGVEFSVIGLGKPVVEALHDTRHAGDFILDLCSRVGGEPERALPWGDYQGYLKHRLEGLAASGQGAVATGSFEDSWVRFLEERGWRFMAHEGIEGFWTSLERESAWWNPVHTRGDWSRHFQTPSGRFEFHSQILEQHLLAVGTGEEDDGDSREERLSRGIARLELAASAEEVCLPHFEPLASVEPGQLVLQPFRPITARSDLGALSPMVLEMFGFTEISGWQTYVELAPSRAHELGLHAGDVVVVESSSGSLRAVVRVLPGCDPDSVHVPLGLGHPPVLGMDEKVGDNPIAIMASIRDPISGRVSLTSTEVSVRLLKRGRGGGPVAAHGGALS